MSHVKPHSVPALPVFPASMSWEGCPQPSAHCFLPFSKHRGLRSRLWIKCPLLNAPLLPYCLQTKPIPPPLGLWSILKWNQRRLIFLLGLHHKRYKSLEHPFSPVPSFKSEHSLFFFALSSRLVQPLRIISSAAARHRAPPHLTAVASGVHSEQDDEELIWLTAHSLIGGVIRATQSRERWGERKCMEGSWCHT